MCVLFADARVHPGSGCIHSDDPDAVLHTRGHPTPPSLTPDDAPVPGSQPPARAQASDAAQDWALKRRQALERASALRAQRKAAERARVAGGGHVVRGLEHDPLPTDGDAPWWESAEPASHAKPDPSVAPPGTRQRRQWGDVPSALAPHRPRHPHPPPATPSPESEPHPGFGGDVHVPGAPGGRLMPWEEELLIKQAEEAYAAMGRHAPPPETLLGRHVGGPGDGSSGAGGGDATHGGDPDVWGPPPPKPKTKAVAKRKPPAAGAVNHPKPGAAAKPGGRAVRGRDAPVREPAPSPDEEERRAPSSYDVPDEDPSVAASGGGSGAVSTREDKKWGNDELPVGAEGADRPGARRAGGRSAESEAPAEAAAGGGRAKQGKAPAGSPGKRPRLPSEAVRKIVDRAVAKQQNAAGHDVDSANEEDHPGRINPPAGRACQRPSRGPGPAHPPGDLWAAHGTSPVEPDGQDGAMGYEEFLKLQERAAAGRGAGEGAGARKPKPSFGVPTGRQAGAGGGGLDDQPDVVAKKKADKAPKKPVAAGAGANARAAGTGGPQGEGDKVLRQMFDKRESRRMNAKPFAAAVQRWRNGRVAAGGHRKHAKPRRERAGGVSVYVRKRPLFTHEQKRGEFDVVTVPDPPAPLTPFDATEVVIHNCQMHADLKRMYAKHVSFDVTRAFGDDAESEEVYAAAAAPMVAGALSGGVGALFMYGQTGSGKTHTMEAIERCSVDALFAGAPSEDLPRDNGLAANAEGPPEADWIPGAVSVRVAYFEIAGKRCTDLLSPQRQEIVLKEVGGGAVGAGAGRPLEPHEYRQLDVQLLGAVEPVATSAEELGAIIAAGKSRRATSATQCNAASSRSHAVLRLTCQLANGATGASGRLTLVDCAGSERKEDNVHHSAEQRKETAEINASLYALKECVRMRRMQHQRFGFNGEGGAGGGHVHVPYRSSHLTRVLMECFVRPDAQLGVIGTVSPASIDTEHSVSTLKTVGLIGGGEEGEGVHEEKEDVPKNLEVRVDGSVSEARVERLVAPVRWSNAHIRAWLAKPGNERFAVKVSVPSTLLGRDIVRMSPSALQNLCGGDAKLAQALHNRLRDEIARCSARK